MGEIEENWQPAKFYCREIKLIYSIWCILWHRIFGIHFVAYVGKMRRALTRLMGQSLENVEQSSTSATRHLICLIINGIIKIITRWPVHEFYAFRL